MALAEKNEGTMSVIPTEDVCTCTDKCEAGEVNTACSVCKNDLKGCTGKERPAETEELAQTEPPKKDNGSAGTIIFIIVALLAVGGVGYYVKIVRPKQQAEDDEDFEDDGYGEGFDPQRRKAAAGISALRSMRLWDDPYPGVRIFAGTESKLLAGRSICRV